jgi:hypothetical protein
MSFSFCLLLFSDLFFLLLSFFFMFHEMYCGISSIKYYSCDSWILYFKWYDVFNNKTITQLSKTSIWCSGGNIFKAACLVFESHHWLFLLLFPKICSANGPSPGKLSWAGSARTCGWEAELGQKRAGGNESWAWREKLDDHLCRFTSKKYFHKSINLVDVHLHSNRKLLV